MNRNIDPLTCIGSAWIRSNPAIMDRKQRIITTALWSVLVVAMLGVIGTGLWAKFRPEPLPVFYDAPRFSLTDQHGKPFGSDDLRGKVWVADFIFTTAPGRARR